MHKQLYIVSQSFKQRASHSTKRPSKINRLQKMLRVGKLNTNTTGMFDHGRGFSAKTSMLSRIQMWRSSSHRKKVMVTPWRMKSPDKVVNYCTEIINKNKKYPCYHSTKIIWNKMTKGLIKQADSKCIQIISVINHLLTFKHFDFLWPFWMPKWNVHPQNCTNTNSTCNTTGTNINTVKSSYYKQCLVSL